MGPRRWHRRRRSRAQRRAPSPSGSDRAYSRTLPPSSAPALPCCASSSASDGSAGATTRPGGGSVSTISERAPTRALGSSKTSPVCLPGSKMPSGACAGGSRNTPASTSRTSTLSANPPSPPCPAAATRAVRRITTCSGTAGGTGGIGLASLGRSVESSGSRDVREVHSASCASTRIAETATPWGMPSSSPDRCCCSHAQVTRDSTACCPPSSAACSIDLSAGDGTSEAGGAGGSTGSGSPMTRTRVALSTALSGASRGSRIVTRTIRQAAGCASGTVLRSAAHSPRSAALVPMALSACSCTAGAGKLLSSHVPSTAATDARARVPSTTWKETSRTPAGACQRPPTDVSTHEAWAELSAVGTFSARKAPGAAARSCGVPAAASAASAGNSSAKPAYMARSFRATPARVARRAAANRVCIDDRACASPESGKSIRRPGPALPAAATFVVLPPTGPAPARTGVATDPAEAMRGTLLLGVVMAAAEPRWASAISLAPLSSRLTALLGSIALSSMPLDAAIASRRAHETPRRRRCASSSSRARSEISRSALFARAASCSKHAAYCSSSSPLSTAGGSGCRASASMAPSDPSAPMVSPTTSTGPRVRAGTLRPEPRKRSWITRATYAPSHQRPPRSPAFASSTDPKSWMKSQSTAPGRWVRAAASSDTQKGVPLGARGKQTFMATSSSASSESPIAISTNDGVVVSD
mmetsp:Transcript_6175/g.24708  ORF Transcript_6175/g.24708 Transcript_6175/m.24708 type:complete len:702 (+) Transcript_6175:60-2165(+)